MMFYKETNFKETPIGRIPKDWEVSKLEKICEKIKAGGTPLTTKKEFWNGNIPFVKIEDMTSYGKYLMKTSSSITKAGLENSNAWLVPENSLLLAMYGSLGEVSINTINVATNQAILGIIPKEKDDVEFLYYWFLYFKPCWRKFAKPTTQANLTAEIVRNSTIPLPPSQERKKIAEILSTIDEAIQKTNEIIAETERLKKGLMQELLSKGLILGFMFDTNVFNAILNEHIDLERLPRNLKYYVTHIQYDEICSTQSEARKGELLKIIEKVPSEVIATEGAVYDVSKYGMAKYMSETDAKQYDEMLRRLKELDEKAGKRKPLENQARDVLIALTSIKNCLILVTKDKNLKKVTEEFNGQAITFEQFQKGEYKEFKDTEMGRIPKHWKVVKLGEIGTFQYGITASAKEEDTGVKFLRITDIRDDGTINWSEVPFCEIGVSELSKYMLKVGDVLFARIGATTGKTCYINQEIRGVFGSYLIRFLPDVNSQIDTRFLHLFTQSEMYWLQVNRMKGGQLKKGLNTQLLKEIKILLPPLEEQRKIAQILSAVDKKLEIERNEKAKLEKIKQGLMDLLLTGKIRVKI